jgi:hypothetical protein
MIKEKLLYCGSFLIVIAGIIFLTASESSNSWGVISASAKIGLTASACNGDLDGDGQINTSDLSLISNAILTNNASGLCADLNDDQAVDSLDLQYLVNMILNPSIPGNVYYIAPNGSDSNDGSIEHPWSSVDHAWDRSERGDTVYIREGTYSEGRNIWLTGGNGSGNQFWTLKAYPGETATFTDARFIADDDYIRIQGLRLVNNSIMQAVSWDGIHEHIEFLDNTFEGEMSPTIYYICNNGRIEGNTIKLTNADSHGLYIMHGSGNIVRNNYVDGAAKYGIHIYDEEKYSDEGHVSITNLLVENNTVLNAGSAGIIISAGESTSLGIEIDGVLVRNNIIVSNNDGITIRYYGSVRNVEIVNNTIYNNEDDGISVSAHDVDGITIVNNILHANRGGHISISSSLSDLSISHNLYYQPESIGSGATDTSPVFGNPLFVDAGTLDFHLQAGSPAIDAGIDVGLPYSGEAPDLGAYEFNP